ncbi:MAG: efflux RND transporter periplasmic adaptor subunit, partial [Gallionellaceae bacterium]|nr:efflux RND transporter periplasmic adaptor subunit [Gallionellaceae bacterium]
MKLAIPRPRVLWWVLPALLVAGLLAYWLTAGKAVAVVEARRQALTETVISSGRIITPERIEVGAELVGSLAEVRVEEGDRVRAGQVLARIDDDEQRAAAEQARRALDEAEARLAQLDEVGRPVADQALAQAEANLTQADSEYARVRRLVEAGFYNQSRLDEARRALDSARAAREAARAQARGAAGVETRLAGARLAQARAALAVAQAKLANTVILAPAAGVVVRKRVEAGDVVTQGKPLFDLAADGETRIVLQVDEKNLGRLALGQQAEVLADAYPVQPFAAEIFHIAPAVDAQKGAVEVKLRVPAPPAFAKPDMTVSVEIRVGRRDDALTLPSAAVHDLAGRPWVLVIENGRAARREIGLGLAGSGTVEVTRGLAEGEAVIPVA